MRIKSFLPIVATFLLAVACEDPESEESVKDEITITEESIDVFSNNVSLDASEHSFEVSFMVNGSWEIQINETEDVSWLEVNPTNGAAGNVIIKVQVSANKTENPREATVTITCGSAKKSFKIIQEGKILLTMEAVDLGLSVKWGAWNIGATKPEEPGDYYTWGDIDTHYSSLDPLTWKEGKTGYDWPSYKWSGTHYYPDVFGSTSPAFTKYCSYRIKWQDNTMYSYWDFEGEADGNTVIDSEDDVANVLLGGNWRMPTSDEFSELLINCSYSWDEEKKGFVFTSTRNGNSIFIPAAGFLCDEIEGLYELGITGRYWSSSLDVDVPSYSHILDFVHSQYLNKAQMSYILRKVGLSIRPVLE